MPHHVDAWLRQQQHRWLRPDAARWLRPDAARFLRPETDVAKVYPALARKYDGQPRLPEGDGGGQFTFGRMNGAADGEDRPRVIITKPDEPRGIEGEENDTNGSPGGDFFGIRNLLESLFAATANLPGIGHNRGPKLEDPPEIPKTKPRRLAPFQRQAANWLSRARTPQHFAVMVGFLAAISAVSWLRGIISEIVTDLDPPRTMEELLAAVNVPRAGTELHHHKMEQHVSKQRKIKQSEIDAPGNRVRIPVLKHRQISHWYRKPNPRFGGLTPRQFLADKPAEVHEQVGLEALKLFGVLKP